ncbi:ABC transporter permease [Thioclava litoralis]|uniref:ABC transporter permease n=1 Tax=Thioclava litoralis TaxID=3076557 RepID=A0ABZ1DXL9_9RHOB|nr:ABC transporter permease [Thioclava sp. FTW29]
MIGGIDIVTLIAMLMTASTPVLLAATGELVVERSGVLNLGVEGMMIMGAIGGFAAAVATGNPVAGFAAAALSGVVMALLFGLLTQIFLSNQVATGLALTLFGLGLSALLGKSFEGVRPPATGKIDFGPLSDLPVLGRILFSHDWVVYLSLALCAATWAFLKFTRAGLILKAVGENHDAAHALGYRVIAMRFAALAFGGALAGIGGAYLSLVRVPQWTEGMTAGAGWIALAIVVFASWRPERALIGSYLFGGITALQLQLQAAGYSIPVHLLSMAPYLVTIVALVLLSMTHRHGAQAGPGSLGKSFHASR